MTGPTSKLARPAGVDDLKLLLSALNEHGVDYLLIGRYALYACHTRSRSTSKACRFAP